MALILDHVNGVSTDNRLENLRIVCPNCNATLDTYCGRKTRRDVTPRTCLRCATSFMPKYPRHRYCSRDCAQRAKRPRPRPHFRRVDRPPYEQLVREGIDAGAQLSDAERDNYLGGTALSIWPELIPRP